MSDFYSFLGWDRLFVDVMRVRRIRSIFPSGKFDRDIEWEPSSLGAICSVDIDARRKAKSEMNELQLLTLSDVRCLSPDTCP